MSHNNDETYFCSNILLQSVVTTLHLQRFSDRLVLVELLSSIYLYCISDIFHILFDCSFFKVGSPKSNKDEPSPRNQDGSWRQAIFKKVVSPNSKETEMHVKKTKEELRELWKKAIHQAILLVRMEKENATLRG